jgi:hypothetical protein
VAAAGLADKINPSRLWSFNLQQQGARVESFPSSCLTISEKPDVMSIMDID